MVVVGLQKEGGKLDFGDRVYEKAYSYCQLGHIGEVKRYARLRPTDWAVRLDSVHVSKDSVIV